MRILAIDPSVLHLGWAEMRKDPKTIETQLISFGTVEAPEELKQTGLVTRLTWMIETLDDIIWLAPLTYIVIEQSEMWGAYKSMASSRSGSLQMLTMLTGALVFWAVTKVGDKNVRLVKVSTWKGQLPKLVTKKRMETKYNCKFRTDDESDAVGLGDWYLERESG